jgi:hypothetical protein
LTNTQSLITSNSKNIANLTEQNRLIQAQIQPVKDAANVFITKLNNLEMARYVADTDIHQIVALKENTVNLTQLVYIDTFKTVTGYSTGSAVTQEEVLKISEEVMKYAQSLRDTGGFNVVVSSIQYNSRVKETVGVIGTYDFTFQLK